MAWPGAQDYEEAIQNPKTAFDDPELRDGRPVLNAQGLPKAISGNFATVFQVESGGKRYAVRCFLREQGDRARRYEVISQHLERHKMGSMAQFRYLPKGIRVGGKWYPILKMEWLAGEPLHQHLAQVWRDGNATRALAQKFLRLMGELARHDVAHGDLQHGNILVVGGELRLVDYDGLYVPGLLGMGSPETGHRNYQHPRRTGADFGPGVDNFSAWVIQLSFLALSLEPALWERLGAGEENLLFRREDFEDPENSDAVEALRRLPLGVGELLAERLIEAVRASPLTVAPLEEIPLPPPGFHAAPSAAAAAPVGAPPPGVPAWMTPEPSAAAPATQAAAPLGAEWLATSEPVAVRRFERPMRLERASVAVAAASLALLAFFSYATGISLVLVGVLVALQAGAWCGYLVVAYVTDDVVRERRALSRRARDAERDAARLERTLAELDAKRERLEGEAKAMDPAELAKLEKAELDALEADLQRTLADLNSRRQASLNGEENDVRAALDELVASRIGPKLREHPIASANVRGLDPTLRLLLEREGISTAADITPKVAQLPALGGGVGPALLAWRHDLEARLLGRAPALPPDVEAPIRARHEADRAVLDVQENQAREAARKRKQELRLKYRGEQARATSEADASARRHLDAVAALEDDRKETQRQLAERRLQAARARRELEGFAGVTFARFALRILPGR